MRSPRDVLASKLAAFSSASKGGRCESTRQVWAASGPRTPHMSFCKRCVPVAFSGVVLRSVAYESPKNALRGAVQKTRRAAWTAKFMRMSGRLAHSQGQASMTDFVQSTKSKPAASMLKSRPVAWRSLHSVVAEVLRDARMSPSALPHRATMETASKIELS